MGILSRLFKSRYKPVTNAYQGSQYSFFFGSSTSKKTINERTTKRSGYSATQLAAELGIAYSSAWYLLHRIRSAMAERDAGYMLSGIVEMDDTYFGAPEEGGMLKWLHTLIGNAKAFVSGTYHGLDDKHLQSYLDEFCYRFNRRGFRDQIFRRLLCAVTKSNILGYADLTR